MDIQRKSSARKKNIRRAIYGLVVVIIVAGVTLGLSKLKPAAPNVDPATVWVDTVKRGNMVRDVRGLGTLVPEDIQWIPAFTEGRVDKLVHKPGDTVTTDTIVIELSNEQLQQELINAELSVKAAKAQLENLKVQLDSATLTQKAVVARAKSDYESAQLQADRNTQLLQEGLVSEITQKLSDITAKNLLNQRNIEQQRLDILSQSNKAQIDTQQANIDQLQESYNLKKTQ
ncbi:MAG: RND transporter, partial [Blastocatellia bacterium]